MTEVYLGQIMMTGFGFAPKGFAQCNGQLLSISQNTALFALLGVSYGGNGTVNFQLPNLQGRTPAGYGASVDPSWQPSPYALGQVAGTETVTLLPPNLPTHTHSFAATTTGGTSKFVGNNVDILGQAGSGTAVESIYGLSTGTLVPLAPSTLTSQGGSLPPENMQPFRVINFCICMSGYFPSRN